MTLFRVHFDQSEPLDIEAPTPAVAQAEAKQRRPEDFIKKIKKVKANG